MRLRRSLGIAAASALLAACGLPVEEGDIGPPLERALGETTADRPAYIERLALYATDRARLDPAATGWPAFAPAPPLLWHDSLAQSARAHSTDMRDTPCFQHPSCDGTDPFKRIQSYWKMPFSAIGENISAGVNDGEEVVRNWIDEVGAPPGTTGHRENTFDSKYQYLGLGYAPGGAQFKGYWTQDFAGVSAPPALPRLPAGSHVPAHASVGAPVTFGVVYYDAAGIAPSSIEVIVDGRAQALPLLQGKPAAGAYQVAQTLSAGCHRYFFHAIGNDNRSDLYPTAGTLGIASAEAAAACPEYMPGGVSVPNPRAPGAGGCSVGGGPRAGAGAAWLSLWMLSAMFTLRRRRGS